MGFWTENELRWIDENREMLEDGFQHGFRNKYTEAVQIWNTITRAKIRLGILYTYRGPESFEIYIEHTVDPSTDMAYSKIIINDVAGEIKLTADKKTLSKGWKKTIIEDEKLLDKILVEKYTGASFFKEGAKNVLEDILSKGKRTVLPIKYV